jgi:hypothetical protein
MKQDGMGVLKMRNYIPIASPARREPVDGKESKIRVSLGFEPAWFSRRCEVDFSSIWHHDPRYRYTTLQKMKEELVRAFPDLPLWDTGKTEDLTTLSGVYGAYLIPHAFGMPLIYAADRWPVPDPSYRVAVKEIECLTPEQVLKSPVVESLFRQMEIMEKEWGKICGYLNWQGVLNNAFSLRGQEIFIDMIDKTELVRHFFTVICEVMIALAREIQERQRRSGFYIDQFSVSNCVMNMISPEMYEQFVFSHDKRIAASFERFGVHTCNWDVTPYIEILSRLPKMGYLDMGIMSDLAKVKAAFPDTYLAVLYSPVALQEEAPEKIQRDIERIYRELSPCDIVCADIQATTPDERVKQILEICRRLEHT